MPRPSPFGLYGQVEQIWLKVISSGSYEVACIPFSAYGIALRDIVVLDDRNYISEVVRASGHRTLRLLFTPDLPAAELQNAAAEIMTEISAEGLMSEWNGARFIAVDVPPDIAPSKTTAAMEAAANSGQAFWEWADATPFARPS